VLVPVVPVELREAVMTAMHSGPGAGHLRWPKLFWLIADRYDWPAMRSDIKRHLAACQVCLRDYPGHQQKADCAPFVTLSRFHRWSMDVVDLGRSPSDFRLAVVFVEHYTKYPVAVPLAAYTGKQLLTALMTFVVAYFGIPSEIVADGHPTHSSKDFADPCTQMGIRLNLSRGQSHTHAGQAERYIRTVTAMLRRSAEEARDWVETLPMVLLYYRAAIHPRTGYSPAYLMYGEQLRLPCAKLLEFRNSKQTVDIESTVQEMVDCLAVANKAVLQTNEHYRTQMIEDYRREHHQSPSTVGVGDLVYVSCTEKMNRQGRVKLDFNRYRGPYTVVEMALKLPLIKIRDPVSGKVETVNRRCVTKSKRRLETPNLPSRRRDRRERIAAPPPIQDSNPNFFYNFRSKKCLRQNSLLFRNSKPAKMSADNSMDADRLLDDTPMGTVSTISRTLSEEEALLDPESPQSKRIKKAEQTFNQMMPVRVEMTSRIARSRFCRDMSAEQSMARRRRSRSHERESSHNGLPSDTRVYKRRDNIGRSRRRQRQGDRDATGYDSGECVSPPRGRAPSTESCHAPRHKKGDDAALRRWIESKGQGVINNGAIVLSGKLMFIHELIKVPVRTYAQVVESTKGKGILPERAAEPLNSKVIVSLVCAEKAGYFNMYKRYIQDFVSFTPDRYRALAWNGGDLKYFARRERERIRLFRATVLEVFDAKCTMHTWTSCRDASKDEQVKSLRRRVADGIAKLQGLYAEDPLVAIMGSSFHLNDRYYRTLQKPKRRPSPFQFGRCMFPGCPTDAVHVTANCPALVTNVSRIQPLKADDDEQQAWDGTAFAAMVDAYVRCGLASLMPATDE
jgi:hypothetical protein